MKIFYWSPFISKVATVSSVIRSAESILKYSKNKSIAKNFLNFMLSEDFQSVIPSTNIMYPVTKIKKLPEAYQFLKIPKVLQLDPSIIKSNKEVWIEEWLNAS